MEPGIYEIKEDLFPDYIQTVDLENEKIQ